jgi:hypothetical protein
MHIGVCMHEHFELITNLFKLNVEFFNFLYIHLKNYDKCKMQVVNNEFNTFKMNESIQLKC